MSKTIEQLEQEVYETWFGSDDNVWIALSLAGEVGEFCNLVKKISRIDFKDRSEERQLQLLKEQGLEIVDCLYYLLKFTQKNGIDLEGVWDLKMRMNRAKYAKYMKASKRVKRVR